MSTYKPSEHDGLKEDGTPDKRMNPEHGFGGDHERAVEGGKKGGQTSGGSDDSTSSSSDGGSASGGTYKPSEHGGLKADGTPDGRMKQSDE
ncbi:hypothetical protein BDY24DRAFT_415994 [Mrakia frigida]|uniref:uncharacterized protein n=1 Tax=Mrakia frigida TaxID=29902 RepID=UPI003FCBF61A